MIEHHPSKRASRTDQRVLWRLITGRPEATVTIPMASNPSATMPTAQTAPIVKASMPLKNLAVVSGAVKRQTVAETVATPTKRRPFPYQVVFSPWRIRPGLSGFPLSAKTIYLARRQSRSGGSVALIPFPAIPSLSMHQGGAPRRRSTQDRLRESAIRPRNSGSGGHFETRISHRTGTDPRLPRRLLVRRH